MQSTTALRLFNGSRARLEIEDYLCGKAVPFQRIGWAEYDNSLEIHGVDDEYRLSPQVSSHLFSMGFRYVFVIHKNGWQTHYRQFGPEEGWRVKYDRKQTSEHEILLEKKCETWPEQWYTSGYVKVIS